MNSDLQKSKLSWLYHAALTFHSLEGSTKEPICHIASILLRQKARPAEPEQGFKVNINSKIGGNIVGANSFAQALSE